MEWKNRTWLLVIALIAMGFVVFLLVASFVETPEYRAPWIRPERPHMFPLEMIFIYSVFVVAAVVSLSYYFLSRRLEERLESNTKMIVRLVGKNDKTQSESSKKSSQKPTNKDVIFRFLSPAERKVLEKLIQGKGTVLQAEISRMDGMTKLKTHRVVKDLTLKGVVKTEAFGKTKRIILAKDVKDAL